MCWSVSLRGKWKHRKHFQNKIISLCQVFHCRAQWGHSIQKLRREESFTFWIKTEREKKAQMKKRTTYIHILSKNCYLCLIPTEEHKSHNSNPLSTDWSAPTLQGTCGLSAQVNLPAWLLQNVARDKCMLCGDFCKRLQRRASCSI